jgi:hypothetical protein
MKVEASEAEVFQAVKLLETARESAGQVLDIGCCGHSIASGPLGIARTGSPVRIE